MAAWWSSQAHRQNVFYKLPEHLSTYYKKWMEKRKEMQSMVASELQRKKNERRIHSTQHIAQVLQPAPREQPGIIFHNNASSEPSDNMDDVIDYPGVVGDMIGSESVSEREEEIESDRLQLQSMNIESRSVSIQPERSTEPSLNQLMASSMLSYASSSGLDPASNYSPFNTWSTLTSSTVAEAE